MSSSQDTLPSLDSVSQSCPPISPSLFAYEASSTPLASILTLSTVNKSQSELSLYSPSPRKPLSILAVKKKYKPVALKTRPIMAELPERFRIVRNILGNPLETLPTLSKHPGPFHPCGRYTLKRKGYIDNAHPGDFLWPVERDLMHHFMMVHHDGFAWNDSERGHFREDFFPPVEIPTVEHKPWVVRNIPIPPGIYKNICELIQRKIDAGVFEPSNSSYRS